MSKVTMPLGSQFSKNSANSPPWKSPRAGISDRAEWNDTGLACGFVCWPNVISVRALSDCSAQLPCKTIDNKSRVCVATFHFPIRRIEGLCSRLTRLYCNGRVTSTVGKGDASR